MLRMLRCSWCREVSLQRDKPGRLSTRFSVVEAILTGIPLRSRRPVHCGYYADVRCISGEYSGGFTRRRAAS
jgi:hypothetical protein